MKVERLKQRETLFGETPNVQVERPPASDSVVADADENKSALESRVHPVRVSRRLCRDGRV